MKHSTVRQAAALLSKMQLAGFKDENFEIHSTKHGLDLTVSLDPLTIARMIPQILAAGLGVQISEYKALGWFVDVTANPGIKWHFAGHYIEEDDDPEFHKLLVIEINKIKQQYAASPNAVASVPALPERKRLEQVFALTGTR